MMIHPLIYTLALLLLGLRVLELNAGLAPTWHNVAQAAIAIGMWSVLIAWYWIEHNSVEQAQEAQAIPTPARTRSRRYRRFWMQRTYDSRTQGTGERTTRTGSHPTWVRLSALFALALGLFLVQVARGTNDQRLKRAALLLIIYGVVVIWLWASPAVLRWQDRTRRAIRFWRSGSLSRK